VLFRECLTSVTVLLAISSSAIRLTRTFMVFFLIGSPPAALLARATLQGAVGVIVPEPSSLPKGLIVRGGRTMSRTAAVFRGEHRPTADLAVFPALSIAILFVSSVPITALTVAVAVSFPVAFTIAVPPLSVSLRVSFALSAVLSVPLSVTVAIPAALAVSLGAVTAVLASL
jgi:hypothetical protein